MNIKENNHMIVSNTDSVFNTVQHPFIRTTLGRLEIEGNILNLIKCT